MTDETLEEAMKGAASTATAISSAYTPPPSATKSYASSTIKPMKSFEEIETELLAKSFSKCATYFEARKEKNKLMEPDPMMINMPPHIVEDAGRIYLKHEEEIMNQETMAEAKARIVKQNELKKFEKEGGK